MYYLIDRTNKIDLFIVRPNKGPILLVDQTQWATISKDQKSQTSIIMTDLENI